MANNYKVKIVDLQNKYKFKIFCSSQMYDDTDLKREVEAIYKAFPKASGTGTAASLDGTAAALMNIDLKGNSGKNLLPNDASVTGDNTINICGKNLAQHMSGYIVTSTGVFKSSNDDCFYFPVVEGETYYCSSTGNRTIGAIYTSIPVAEQTCIQGTNINNVPKKGSFVASATGIMVVYANTPTSQSVIDTFMVIKGNTAPTEYEPYIGNTYPINLGDIKLQENDEIVYINKKYYINDSSGTQITDTTLISQLNALRNAESYEGQTNISQTNNDLPFIITASAIKDLSNL